MQSGRSGGWVGMERDRIIARNTVYAWWAGATEAPALIELQRVATQLGVPLAYLVDAWAGDLWPDPQHREPVLTLEGLRQEIERDVLRSLRQRDADLSGPERPGRGRRRPPTLHAAG